MTVVTATYRFSGVGEDFGPRASGMVTLHTTEPSDPLKTTVWDALALARWQDRDDTVGSYNRLICSDGVVSTVPDHHASGGINPSSAGFKPRAWLYDMVDAGEIRNPNYFTLNLSAMGRKAHFDANGWPDRIIDGFARSIIEEEKRIGRRVVITQHADFQPPPNRSDVGDIATALVKARYAVLTMAVLPLRYKPELWEVGSAGADLRTDPHGNVVARLEPGTKVLTLGESLDGMWRVAVAGTDERMYWVVRGALIPLIRGGDPLLHQGIREVVDARLKGAPLPSGASAAQIEAAVQAESERWKAWLARHPQ